MATSKEKKTQRPGAIVVRKLGRKGAGIAVIQRRPRPRQDSVREDRISTEVVVDAHDGAERAIGWFGYLEDRLEFPFTASCSARRAVSPLLLGDEVEVISMAPADECTYDIFVVIRWEHGGLGVPLSQLTPTAAGPATHTAVADWHYWVGQGYQFG
jgi:hypothetical protein